MTFDFKNLTGKTILTDGAWGTQLQKQGLTPGSCPDACNLNNPAAVLAVARSYVEVGSQVILTNTLRATRFGLQHYGLAEKAYEINVRGAELSRQAAGKDVAVFASMGPSGKIVMMEEVDPQALYDAFLEQAKGLQEGGVDVAVCETFTELAEIEIAAKAARAAGLEVVLSLTFGSGPDGTSTMMGNTPVQVAAVAARVGAAAVGANCGAGPEAFIPVAKLYRQHTKLPIWVKPNAGLPVQEKGKTVFPQGPEEFAGFGPKLVAAGATFVGGCCGTTPKHIAALAVALSKGP